MWHTLQALVPLLVLSTTPLKVIHESNLTRCFIHALNFRIVCLYNTIFCQVNSFLRSPKTATFMLYQFMFAFTFGQKGSRKIKSLKSPFWETFPELLYFLYVMFTSLSSLYLYLFRSSVYSSPTVSIDKSERIVTKFAFIDTILKYPKATKPWHRLRKNRDVLSTYLSFWENSSHRLYVVCQSLIRWGCNRYVACMARQQVFRILEYQIRLVNSKVVLFLLVKFFLRSCIGVDIFFRHGTDDQNGGKIWITFA